MEFLRERQPGRSDPSVRPESLQCADCSAWIVSTQDADFLQARQAFTTRIIVVTPSNPPRVYELAILPILPIYRSRVSEAMMIGRLARGRKAAKR